MRAVNGSLGHSPNEAKRVGRPSPGRRARLGVPMGERVRMLRAVEDQSGPIPIRITSGLGRIVYNVRRFGSAIAWMRVCKFVILYRHAYSGSESIANGKSVDL